jgi:hypothetical protein
MYSEPEPKPSGNAGPIRLAASMTALDLILASHTERASD